MFILYLICKIKKQKTVTIQQKRHNLIWPKVILYPMCPNLLGAALQDPISFLNPSATILNTLP